MPTTRRGDHGGSRAGTGIDLFGKAHPERTFDVGIADSTR